MLHIHSERPRDATPRRPLAQVAGRATAVLVGVVLLAGCSGGSAKSSSAEVTPAAKASGAASASTSATASSTTASVHTTPSGNIKQTIAPHVVPTKRAVALDKVSPVSGNVAVSLAGVKSVTVKAIGPGEIAGAALAVTVRIKNDSGHALDVGSAYVTLIDSAGNTGTPTTAAPSRPLLGAISSGSAAEGVYVFSIAKSVRNPVNVVVSYSAKAPAARFVGNAA